MWLLAKNLAFTVLVPGTFGVWIPLWGAGARAADFAPPWDAARIAATVPLAAGAALYFACLWQFGVRGRGTPAPIDPPKHLVVRGPYRYLRNPMYLGVLLVVIGLGVFLRSSWVLWYAGAGFVMFNAFVFLIEEPMLRRQFGGEYAAYCRAVSRWLPGRPYQAGISS